MTPETRRSLGVSTPEEIAKKSELKSEKELQEQICALLRRRDIPYIRPAMFRKSSLPKGWPDFTFAYKGMPIAFECKTGTGVCSEEQLSMHAQMRAHGWMVVEVRVLDEAQLALTLAEEIMQPEAGKSHRSERQLDQDKA